MVNSRSNSNGTPSSEGTALLGFKSTLNTLIPKFTNQGENPVNTESTSILEPSMLIALDKAITYAQEQIKMRAPALGNNNPSLLQRIQSMNTSGKIDQNFVNIVRELQATYGSDVGLSSILSNTGTIIDEFESLPAQTQAKISTGQALFRPTMLDPKSAAKQGYEAVKTAQSYFGIEDANTTLLGDHVTVSEKTSKAIREQMAALQTQNSSLGGFDAPIFDKRAIAFLENLQAKQMKNSGVTKESLNTTLLQIWSVERMKSENPNAPALKISSDMEELGKTSSLLAAMRYMVSGGLNNGTTTSPPTVQKSWDLQWTNNSSGDHFYSPSVYATLSAYGQVDVSELLQKSPFQFRDENLVEAIQRLREKANTPEGKANQPLQDMVKQFDHFEKQHMDSKLTQHQVGMISMEIMSIQANKLCIADKDINKAIDSGRFMPHLADLNILNAGLGYPPGGLEKLPPENRKHDVFAETILGIDLLKYRSKAFEARFGSMSNEAAQNVISSKYKDFQNVKTDYVNDTMQSPIKRYSSLVLSAGGEIERGYEARRQSYLNSLGARLQENGCKAPELNAGADRNKPPATIAPTQRPAVVTPIPTPTGSGTPNRSGSSDGESTCVADKIGQGNCSKPTTEINTESTCVADKIGQGSCSRQFGSATGSGTIDTHTAISETMETATGNPAQEPQTENCLAADLVAQGSCKAPSQTARP